MIFRFTNTFGHSQLPNLTHSAEAQLAAMMRALQLLIRPESFSGPISSPSSFDSFNLVATAAVAVISLKPKSSISTTSQQLVVVKRPPITIAQQQSHFVPLLQPQENTIV